VKTVSNVGLLLCTRKLQIVFDGHKKFHPGENSSDSVRWYKC